MIQPFPLDWPAGHRRSGPLEQERSSVKSPIATLYRSIHTELKAWKATGVIISSNAVLKKDGTPAARQTKPADTGAVVYFWYRNVFYGLSLDHFTDLPGNLKEIRDILNRFRRFWRLYNYGVMLKMLAEIATVKQPQQQERQQQKQEPPPKQKTERSAEDWRTVLELGKVVTWSQVRANYLRLSKKYHPDKGGKTEDFQRLQAAYEKGKKHFNFK
jgi:hypothetical protein